MSYDFLNLEQFLEMLRQGIDFVIGNRFKGGIKKGAMPKLHRYFGVPILSFMARVIYGVKIGDFHCGIRGFSRESVMALDLKSEGMVFATEIIGAFSKKGMGGISKRRLVLF